MRSRFPPAWILTACANLFLLATPTQARSTADMFQFRLPSGDTGDASLVFGTSTLDVADGVGPHGQPGLKLDIDTTQLEPGSYTVWAAIFNNRDACVDGCNGADLGNPAVEGALIWATGGIVGDDGVGSFNAFLELNHPAGEVRPNGTVSEGLRNLAAEVHGVLRYHGPASADPDALDAQLYTFDGGCDAFRCFNPQATIHSPLTPIPEPSTLFIASMGLGSLLLARRKK